MKFAVQRKSLEEVIIEANSEEEALEIAYDTDPKKFREIDYDWEVYNANDSEAAVNAPSEKKV